MTSVSRTQTWIGRGLSALPVLFLAFDGAIKFVKIQPVTDSFAQLGLPDPLAPVIGALELACLALYVIPGTAALGSILMTGFLGGAVAIHLRVGDPLFTHTLFPVYVGLFLWVGLFLREPRLRALIPWSR